MPITLRGHCIEIRLSTEEGNVIHDLPRRAKFRENSELRSAIELAQLWISEEQSKESRDPDSLFDPLICRPVRDPGGGRMWLLLRKTESGWILLSPLYECDETDPNVTALQEHVDWMENKDKT